VNRSALWADGDDPERRPRRPQPGGNRPVRWPARPARAAPSWPQKLRRRYGWRLVAAPFLAAITVITLLLISATPNPPPGGDLPAAPPSPVPVVPVPLPDRPPAGSASISTPPASDGAAPGPSVPEGTVATAEPTPGSAAEPTIPQTAPTAAISIDPAEVLPSHLLVGALPAGEPFAVSGDGGYRVIGGAGPQAGTAPTVITYTVEIENGFTPAEGDESFAQFVDRTLADPRSWITVKGVSLQRLNPPDADPDFRVTLASQQTVRALCGFSVPLESSCYTRTEGRVVINDARWVRGSLTYGTDLTSYREYAINHEVGHALGYGHQPCGENGVLAPVMMQQSWSASNDALAGINGSTAADGKSCRPNPWPDPAGAEGQATAATG
jgi:hypothetical protein